MTSSVGVKRVKAHFGVADGAVTVKVTRTTAMTSPIAVVEQQVAAAAAAAVLEDAVLVVYKSRFQHT